MPCPAPPEPAVSFHSTSIEYARLEHLLCTSNQLSVCAQTIPFDSSRWGCFPIAWMRKPRLDCQWLGQGHTARKEDKIGSANLHWPLGNSKLNLGSLLNYSFSSSLFSYLWLPPSHFVPWVNAFCLYLHLWPGMNESMVLEEKTPNSKLESFCGDEALLQTHILEK